MIEEKYQKPTLDYYATFFGRKISNIFLAYPEFLFLLKIILGLVALTAAFLLFRKFVGGF